MTPNDVKALEEVLKDNEYYTLQNDILCKVFDAGMKRGWGTTFLITSGSGGDGDEWQVECICATREIAERRKKKMLEEIILPSDSFDPARKKWGENDLTIVQWDVERDV